MTAYNVNGDYIEVTMSRSEVRRFKRSWPCNHLPDSSITFVFDRRGDLVKYYVNSSNQELNDEDVSQQQALAALSVDAWDYVSNFRKVA